MANVLLGAIPTIDQGYTETTEGEIIKRPTTPIKTTFRPFEASVESGGLYLDQPKRGDFVIPGDGGMVTLPTDTGVTFFPGGPTGGGGAAPDLQADKPVETSTEKPAGMNKKNMLLFGIGGLVLAYLLLRKK